MVKTLLKMLPVLGLMLAAHAIAADPAPDPGKAYVLDEKLYVLDDYRLLDGRVISNGNELFVNAPRTRGEGNFQGPGFGGTWYSTGGSFWGVQILDGVIKGPWDANNLLWNNAKTPAACTGYISSVVYPWVSWKAKCGASTYVFTSVVSSRLAVRPDIDNIDIKALGLNKLIVAALSPYYLQEDIAAYLGVIGYNWAIKSINPTNRSVVLDLAPTKAGWPHLTVELAGRDPDTGLLAFDQLLQSARALLVLPEYHNKTLICVDDAGGFYPACTSVKLF